MWPISAGRALCSSKGDAVPASSHLPQGSVTNPVEKKPGELHLGLEAGTAPAPRHISSLNCKPYGLPLRQCADVWGRMLGCVGQEVPATQPGPVYSGLMV
ncbi:unnamed protein product [Pleuronectes platessa]|uniref:Uncharacterized protein n=1 Tax=Pleuronectes platessa TaxID=8262 RepID=A0A9N7YTG8_PLEPL|nr:unnamed protein product [Pleuronectes platessa]